MTPAEFTQIITLTFHLVAAGSEVKVEPWLFEMPRHVSGGRAVAMTVPQGGDRYLVHYDPDKLKSLPKSFWVKIAFHEACHAGLFAFGTNKKEIKEAEEKANDCQDKWLRWLAQEAKRTARLKQKLGE